MAAENTAQLGDGQLGDFLLGGEGPSFTPPASGVTVAGLFTENAARRTKVLREFATLPAALTAVAMHAPGAMFPEVLRRRRSGPVAPITTGFDLRVGAIELAPFRRPRTMGDLTLIASPGPPFTFFINGVDRTGMVKLTNPAFAVSRMLASMTARFTVEDLSGGSYQPQEDDTVQIFDEVELIFDGTITRVDYYRRMKRTETITDVSCSDAGTKLNTRIVGRFYDQNTWGVIVPIAESLVLDYLADLGVTFVATADSLIGDMLFYYIPVMQALKQLANYVNTDVFVDVNKVVRFIDQTQGFRVNGNSFTDASGNWQEVKAEYTTARRGNKVYALSSRNLANLWTDTYAGRPGGFYRMTYPPSNLDALPEITENGAPQVVVTRDNASAGVPYDYYRFSATVQKNPSATPLSSSDTVAITVLGPLPFAGIAQDDADIAANGLKELVIQAGNITSMDDLQTIAEAWLARSKDRAAQLTITTYQSGFAPGDQVVVNLSGASGAPAVSDTFIIQQVDSVPVLGKQLVPGSPIHLLSTLLMTNAQFQRTSDPARYSADIVAALRTPIDRVIEHIAFELAGTDGDPLKPGLTVGVKTPLILASKTGVAGFVTLAFNSLVQGAVTTADIQVDMLQNGTSIFPGGQPLTLKAGTATVTAWTFATNPLQIAVGDIFTVSIIAADSMAKDGIIDLVVYG